MILIVDVSYSDDSALAAGMVIESWESNVVVESLTVKVDSRASYIPGKFYLRELPCIVELLKHVEHSLECIVVDGYVTLGADECPGLGMRLWQHLDGKVPVVGVAKTKFLGTPKNAEILRGGSSKPLFVTAAGIDLELAKSNIVKMIGKFRIPDLIKATDRLSRNLDDS
ncbi:endonuclease V [Burkholderia lata]|uniref:Endonuclease V n=1 Tax=Burkholderia lata (strain ATCC 17760 / DSM 23089 / LMG 22485 / NCIMB 9086 / R18194 / 383) TaxID=482957 RepID=A0A6P2JG97_BURL3|nr:endonuclease V [Burkholderia lata]VWB41731.1 Endonuclease V [Burkholderia lata]